MTTVYLIRHSEKERNFGYNDTNDSFQIKNEKWILSCAGEIKAQKLSNLEDLTNIDELWSSNYVRALETARYISYKNNIKINISSAFDERHYGYIDQSINKEEFWINQFINKDLKFPNGESRYDVQKRFDKKLQEIISNNNNKKVAIVCHNACILFYLLKYCKLENAQLNKKLTISYKNKILINENIMSSPSIMKLQFDNNNLLDVNYIEIN